MGGGVGSRENRAMNSSFNYLAFVTGSLGQSSHRAFHDGMELADQCLHKLEAIEPAGEPDKQFPPKLLILLASLAQAAPPPTEAGQRIKDLATVQGVRPNQLVGYGLVVGLDGTGDQATQAPG